MIRRWRTLNVGLGTVIAFALIGIAIIVILIGLLNQAKTSSSTSSQGVSLQSYNSVQNGMTLQQVQDILGTNSRVESETALGGITSEIVEWQGGAFGTQVINVTFENGVVIGKAEAGL